MKPSDSVAQNIDHELYEKIDLRGLRVLMAEDNAINQKVGKMTLEGLGAVVDLAANGLEAVDMVSQFEYDLILMDIRMPEMDGVEACRVIRSNGCDVPMYALTADAMKGDRERFIAAGMNGYLSKPLLEKDILKFFRSYIPGEEKQMDLEDSAEDDVLDLDAEKLPLFERERFYKLIGGNHDAAVAILSQFMDLAVQYLEDASVAFKGGDNEKALSGFHKLSGAAASVCAIRVHTISLNLERMLKGEDVDSEVVVSLIKDLHGSMASLIEHLNYYLAEGG